MMDPAPDNTEKAPLLNLKPLRALWIIAWPVVALGILRSGFFLADSAWVGRLGPHALEGQGGASFAYWIIHIWGDLAAVGLLALVARAVGAGETERVRHLATQGTWLALILSAVLVSIAGGAPRAYFTLLRYKGEAFGPSLEAGIAYLKILLLGSPALMVFLVVHAVFRGIGDTRTPLVITAGSLVLNILLDPLLMFGLGFVPGLGVRGAALASVLSESTAAVVGLKLLARHRATPAFARPDPHLWRTILRISLPMAIAGFGFCLVYVFLGPIVTAFGPGAMAALGIGHRIESIAFLFTYGMGVATGALVGQNLGAGTPVRARLTVATAERVTLTVLLPLAVAFYLYAPETFRLFTDDIPIQQAGSGYLRWAALVLLFMGLEVLYEEAFAVAGHTLPPLVVSMPLTAARIPIAFYLSRYTFLGLDGVWVAIALSTFLKGIILRAVFERGTWAAKLGKEA